MSKSVSVTKDIDVSVICDHCMDYLSFELSSDSWGDLTVEVSPCECQENKDE